MAVQDIMEQGAGHPRDPVDEAGGGRGWTGRNLGLSADAPCVL